MLSRRATGLRAMGLVPISHSAQQARWQFRVIISVPEMLTSVFRHGDADFSPQPSGDQRPMTPSLIGRGRLPAHEQNWSPLSQRHQVVCNGAGIKRCKHLVLILGDPVHVWHWVAKPRAWGQSCIALVAPASSRCTATDADQSCRAGDEVAAPACREKQRDFSHGRPHATIHRWFPVRLALSRSVRQVAA